MKLPRFVPPLMPLAICFAMVSAAAALERSIQGSHQGAARRQRVVASGRLIGTRDLQQVVTWQTAGVVHLAIKTIGSRPRILWETDAGNSESNIDSVRVADLDADGVPEIISLWSKGSSPDAALRVFHWKRDQSSFIELQFEDQNYRVRSYRIVRGNGASRLAVDAGPERGARPVVREYELRGSNLVRVGGGLVVATKGESGIEGQAVISPTHPGPVRQGQSDTAPYKTTIVIWNAGNNREVARIDTGSDGRFRVVLPPGTYRVGSPPRSGRFLPRAGEETVTVAEGKFAHVTISFDSGMR